MAPRIRGDVTLKKALSGIRSSVMVGVDKDIRDALEPMRRTAQVNATRLRVPGPTPRGGHLDQGVVVRKIPKSGPLVRTFWVSFTRRARYLAHLVEFGTAPHYQPKRKIMHPGARPKPFFTPAFEMTKSETLAILGKRTWARIEQTALRFGRRGK